VIEVKTFLSKPNIQPPEQVSISSFSSYFYDIEDKEVEMEIKKVLEPTGNSYGCVLITEGKNIILDDIITERLPLYWVMLTDMVLRYISMPIEQKTVSIEPYFSFTKKGNQQISFSIGNGTPSYELPEKEFLLALLQGGKKFYHNYLKLSPVHHYPYLKDELDQLITKVESF